MAIADKPWNVAVSEGLVPGYGFINKFGKSASIDSGDGPAYVWEGNGIYTVSTVADITQIASTDNNDIYPIKIFGLDSQYHECEQIIRLRGQTPVTLETPLIFSHRMKNPNGATCAGRITLATSAAVFSSGVADGNNITNIRAYIDIGNNQTLMCIYMIPAGKTGYLMNTHITLLKSGVGRSAQCSLNNISFGSTCRIVKHPIEVTSDGTSTYQNDWEYPDPIQEKTIVALIADSVSNNDTIISGGFQIRLKDND